MISIMSLLNFLILALAFVFGFVLSRACAEELNAGKPWYARIAVASLVFALLLLVAPSYASRFPTLLTLIFISITNAVLYFFARHTQPSKRFK
ncbi:hypothetical protein D6817_00065 [Candidatus Pacearchaeota archaeon]|nr:MAG: hypothetical protein D6817_00065 [Candidatus Pacearchaeota archaeon]